MGRREVGIRVEHLPPDSGVRWPCDLWSLTITNLGYVGYYVLGRQQAVYEELPFGLNKSWELLVLRKL